MSNKSLAHPQIPSRRWWKIVLLALILPLTSCNLPKYQAPTGYETESTNTLIAQPMLQTDVPPGELMPTLTPPPMVSVSMDTNCRTGPDKQFDKLGVLLVGEKAELVGKNTVANYWVVKNPDAPGTCWLWGMYATVEGNTDYLPEITSPPTPTSPPPTAAPYTDFTVSFVNICDLSGSPWANFRISNTGTLPLESQSLHIRDTTASTNMYGPATSDKPFRATVNCDDTTLVESIAVGSTAYSRCFVSSAVPGHTAQATIKICSQNFITGSCVEKIVTFVIP